MEYSQHYPRVNFLCGAPFFPSAKSLWGQEDLNLNTHSSTYLLGPLSKNYIILETISLAIIELIDRNTKITVLLEFNMIAYVNCQLHTKLFM